MWKDAPEEGVDNHTAQQSGEEDRCAMPALIDIRRVVKSQKTAGHGPTEPYSSCEIGYPAKDGTTASHPTQKDRLFGRRKHEDTMVLPS